MVMVALVRLVGCLMAKQVGWGSSRYQTQPVVLSPFPQCELLLLGQTKSHLSMPMTPSINQLPTPLLRLVLPNAGCQEGGDSHQATLRDPLCSRSTLLTAAARCHKPPAHPPLFLQIKKTLSQGCL